MARITLRVLFVISLAFNVAFVLHLITSHPGGGGSIPDLNLTSDQERRMRDIRMLIHRENEPIKGQIRLCQEKLMAALRAEKVDLKVANSCVESIGRLQKRIQENSVRELVEFKKVLSPEQCDCLIEGITAQLNRSTSPCSKSCCKPGH
jgi:Spy/CpxP family protein refolding chaperone